MHEHVFFSFVLLACAHLADAGLAERSGSTAAREGTNWRGSRGKLSARDIEGLVLATCQGRLFGEARKLLLTRHGSLMGRQVAKLSLHFLRPAQACRGLLLFFIVVHKEVSRFLLPVAILLGLRNSPLRRALQLDVLGARVLRHQVLHVGILGGNLLAGQTLLARLQAPRARILLLVFDRRLVQLMLLLNGRAHLVLLVQERRLQVRILCLAGKLIGGDLDAWKALPASGRRQRATRVIAAKAIVDAASRRCRGVLHYLAHI